MTTTQKNKISYVDNFEGNIWVVIYVQNKIDKAQVSFLTLIFIILGSTTFNNFSQASSSMYAAFFGITQDPYLNPCLFTKLVPLSLGFAKSPFSRNIKWPLTPTALPTQRNVIKNIDSLNLFYGTFLFPPITFISPSFKIKEVPSKFNKNK